MTAALDDLKLFGDRYGEAWNAHDPDAIMAMHPPDTSFRLHMLGAPPPLGRLRAEPTGQKITFAGLDVLTVKGNLVHHRQTYPDLAAALAQLEVL